MKLFAVCYYFVTLRSRFF